MACSLAARSSPQLLAHPPVRAWSGAWPSSTAAEAVRLVTINGSSWLLGTATAAAVGIRRVARMPRRRLAKRGTSTVILATTGDDALAAGSQAADKQQLLRAVANDGWVLADAPADLQADPDVVRAAVASTGHALQFAAPQLRSDRELVMVAVAQDGYALKHVPEALQADKQVVNKALAASGFALQYASRELRSDPAVVKAAIKNEPHALRYASSEVLANREVVMAAVSRRGGALEYADESLRADREVVKRAVANHWCALERYAAPELQTDPQLLRIARRSKMRLKFQWAILSRVANLLLLAKRFAEWATSWRRSESQTSPA
eukprot:CAMPEP_0204606260 /NCGR_PEP_ID=MMETSP0661-20131031/58980_1 /ASSEMBLY_ACC=CAM_ASM_000606 /TAXON_ID=109239 /ORGANISM="Alexandrium margalefi, Strain AMGDE01CS-322" /LENGTH=321 /DNA_ID=CAMNT_0051617569 /DNA_START=116 /DNA_END=1081 /DNA_ORIENTATION=+